MSHPNFFSSVQPDPQLASIFPSNQLPRLLHTPTFGPFITGHRKLFGFRRCNLNSSHPVLTPPSLRCQAAAASPSTEFAA